MIVVDEEFVAQLRAKNPRHQKQLFDGYAKLFLTVSRRYTPAHVDPVDNLHDAFIKIFEKIDLFDINRGNFEVWAKRVVINCALEKLNKRSYTHEKYPEMINETLEEINIEHRLQAEDIIKIINQLPDGYKQVFNMYEVEGYSHKEIGEILGIKEVNSRSNLFRAKKLLQELISTQNYQTKWMNV